MMRRSATESAQVHVTGWKLLSASLPVSGKVASVQWSPRFPLAAQDRNDRSGPIHASEGRHVVDTPRSARKLRGHTGSGLVLGDALVGFLTRQCAQRLAEHGALDAIHQRRDVAQPGRRARGPEHHRLSLKAQCRLVDDRCLGMRMAAAAVVAGLARAHLVPSLPNYQCSTIAHRRDRTGRVDPPG